MSEMRFEKQDNWDEIVPSYAQMELDWQKLRPPKGKLVLRGRIAEQTAWIRMNDFPDEPLYTLIIGDVEIINFNEWPVKWRK